jgi:hypothetical protein
VVKYHKISPAAAANQIAENARIPPAADLQINNIHYFKIFKKQFKNVLKKFKKAKKV